MNSFDQLLFHWLAAGFTPDARALPLALAAATAGAWAALLVLVAAAWQRPQQWLYLVFALAAAGLAALLAHRIAAGLGYARPFSRGFSPDYLLHGDRGSLPSTHATVLFCLAFVLALRDGLRTHAGAMAVVALLTCWGRVYAGVHFPLDIGAGLLLAACIAAGFALVQRLARAVSQRFAAPPALRG